MMNSNSYIENRISKTNTKVSILKNNKSFYSIYNPQRDVDFFCSNEKFKNSGFICIAGIGNGYHIKKLSEIYPDKFILAFELNNDSLDFLFKTNNFEFTKNKKIKLTTLENLQNEIINFYNPIIHGNFYFTYIKSWLDFHIDFVNEIENKINNAISNISADISVQSHFGKIWMHNILENIKFINNNNLQNNFKINISKTAAIIAAGPSLDETILKLKKNLNQYFIISTDTAYPSLLENNIIPEIVVSIDAQIYSREHFIGNKKRFANTIFLLDLCSNSSITKIINPKNILFFNNGHPFCNFIEQNTKCNFIKLNSGRGTVTSTAWDFAIKCGFKNIELFGTDFSFYHNKPYAKSTYLEKQFLNLSCKLMNLESQYTKLMFRTETITDNKGTLTTKLLNEYKDSQEQMFKQTNINIFCASEKCNPMNLKLNNKTNNTCINNEITFVTSTINLDFLKEYYLKLSQIKSDKETDIIYPILPLLAWGKNKKIDFFSIINLAKKLIHNYTIRCYEC